MRHDDREPCCWTPYPEGHPPRGFDWGLLWAFLSLVLGAALLITVIGVIARAEDRLPDGSSEAEPGVRPAPGYQSATLTRRWVWLPRQRLWGYGYRRYDGLWVIDPGTKRYPARGAAIPRAPAGRQGPDRGRDVESIDPTQPRPGRKP